MIRNMLTISIAIVATGAILAFAGEGNFGIQVKKLADLVTKGYGQ